MVDKTRKTVEAADNKITDEDSRLIGDAARLEKPGFWETFNPGYIVAFLATLWSSRSLIRQGFHHNVHRTGLFDHVQEATKKAFRQDVYPLEEGLADKLHKRYIEVLDKAMIDKGLATPEAIDKFHELQETLVRVQEGHSRPGDPALDELTQAIKENRIQYDLLRNPSKIIRRETRIYQKNFLREHHGIHTTFDMAERLQQHQLEKAVIPVVIATSLGAGFVFSHLMQAQRERKLEHLQLQERALYPKKSNEGQNGPASATDMILRKALEDNDRAVSF